VEWSYLGRRAWLLMRVTTMCMRNLARRKLRTLLTVLGITVAVCFTVAVGATTSRYATNLIEMNTFFRGAVVVVAKNVFTIEGFPLGGALPQEIVSKIEETGSVEKAVPMLFNLGFRLGEPSGVLPINATVGLPVEEFSMILGSSSLKAGRLPMSSSSQEMLVGSSICSRYGLAVGSQLDVRGHEVTVCGIIRGSSIFLDNAVVMSLALAQEIFEYPMQVSMVIAKPKLGVTEAELAYDIEQRIDYVTALTENQRNEMTKPIVDIAESLNVTLQGMLLSLSTILVAIVGMINVSERRRDFAALNAIGAPPAYAFGTVVIESCLIGVLATLLGIALGSLLSVLLASFWTAIPYGQFVADISRLIPPAYLAEVFLAGVGACCFGGIIPAINATRMRIAENLRAEY
jgi:putative ABC transport system permease protein